MPRTAAALGHLGRPGAELLLTELEQLAAAGTVVLTIGLACFVGLPLARLLIMLGAFVRLRDRLYVIITLIVLGLVAATITTKVLL
ncbi:DUF1634 domain-containing protein [Propionibacteriaceae bacterium Y1700]|uniref:DUF1634 domain-containing protein n=1 Tax=Microlunatus sp. Y1700 TaxID=3418487 RepID=UPI003DA705D3